MRKYISGSLQLRVALGTALASTVLATLVAVVLLGSQTRILNRQVDRDLQKAMDLVLHRLDEDRFPPDKEMLDLGHDVSLRILDQTQAVLLQSHHMAEEVPPDLLHCCPGRREWVWRERDDWKVVVAPWSGGWLVMARNRSHELEAMRRLGWTATWILLCTPLASALLAFLSVRSGLAPLRRLASATEAIEADTLGTRMPLADLPRELRPLAQALNDAFERLERCFIRQGELNSDMAHELRTPLHGLRLEAEGLLQRPGLTSEAQDTLGGILEILDHLARVVDQMLFLARAGDPSTVIHPQPVDADQLLRGLADAFEALAEERGIGIHIDAHPGLRAAADPTLLRRAVYNLVANALAYTPAGTHLVLSARGVSEGIELTILDEGPGLPEDVLRRLGERFVRPDLSRTRASGGAGLGLAIVKEIVKLHRGRLTFENRSPGLAASITLPPA